jgi:hypothetical protein
MAKFIGDGTLTIRKLPCESKIRNEMKYTIEKIDELREKVEIGENAKVELNKVEERFKELCEMIVEKEEE